MNLLDADPALAEQVDAMRQYSPSLVPVAKNGRLAAFVNRRNIGHFAPATPLPVSDYVAGLELLGYRFELGNDGSGLYQLNPVSIPDAWQKRALSIMGAFGTGRSVEVTDYLAERAGADHPEPVT